MSFVAALNIIRLISFKLETRSEEVDDQRFSSGESVRQNSCCPSIENDRSEPHRIGLHTQRTDLYTTNRNAERSYRFHDVLYVGDITKSHGPRVYEDDVDAMVLPVHVAELLRFWRLNYMNDMDCKNNIDASWKLANSNIFELNWRAFRFYTEITLGWIAVVASRNFTTVNP